MAGRIRTIKPELLEDERVASLSDRAFRLFIGCLLCSDDYGNMRWSSVWLRGQVFWGRSEVDAADVVAAQAELVFPSPDSGLLRPYRVNGQWYAHVGGWDKHQRVNHPGAARVPGPGKASGFEVSGEILERLKRFSVLSQESLLPDLRSPITDHRSENTSAMPPSESDDSPDSSSTESAEAPSESVRQVWNAYVAGWQSTIGQGRLPVLTSKRRQQIRARLKSYSVDDLARACGALWASSWHVEQGQTAPELVFRADERIEWWLSRAGGAQTLASEPEPPPPPDLPLFDLPAVPAGAPGQQRPLLDKSRLNRSVL